MAIESYRGPYNQILNMFLNPAERAHGLISGSEDRADITNMLLMELIDKIGNLTINISGNGSSGGSSETVVSGDVDTIWKAQDPVEILKQGPRTTDAIYTNWIDLRNVKRCLIDINSTLDQVCSIQLIGNIVQNQNSAKNMGALLNCPASSGLDIGVGISDDWHPYVCLAITPLVAPTSGEIIVYGVSQV